MQDFYRQQYLDLVVMSPALVARWPSVMFTFARQQDVGRHGSHFANDGGATGGVSVCQGLHAVSCYRQVSGRRFTGCMAASEHCSWQHCQASTSGCLCHVKSNDASVFVLTKQAGRNP